MNDAHDDNLFEQTLRRSLTDLADDAPGGVGGGRVVAALRRRSARRVVLGGSAALMSAIVFCIAAWPIVLHLRQPPRPSRVVRVVVREPSILHDPPAKIAMTLEAIGISGSLSLDVPVAPEPATPEPVAFNPSLTFDWQQGLLDNPLLVGVVTMETSGDVFTAWP